MDRGDKERKIQEHLQAIRKLDEAGAAKDSGGPPAFYGIWHVLVGGMIGSIAALVSLAMNMVGALAFGVDPMRLVRVYLTFPMGEQALVAEEGLVLFIGSGLYILTGASFGIVFHLAMRLMFRDASVGKRFLLATIFGLGLWIVSFYLILSWLQPMLLGDNWIVRLVPVWVAAATHLCFAWCLLVGEMFGNQTPFGKGVNA